MKILELHIIKFRGILDLTLNFNGKNAAIYGPNGVGKSAVVDAIDFLLTGEILRLSGTDTGDVSTSRHGPHIGSSSTEAIVSARIQSINGKIFTVSRSIADKEHANIDTAYLPEFTEMVAYAKCGAHCLTRREILQFILTSPAKRAAQIQSLLDFPNVKIARDALLRLKKKANQQFKDAKETYDLHQRRLKEILGTTDTKGMLAKINEQRTFLSGPALEALSTVPFVDGLLYTDSRENSTLNECIRSSEKLLILLPSLLPAIREKNATVLDAAAKISAESTSIEKANTITLISAGIALLDNSGICPLCLHQWPSDIELRKVLTERKEKNEILTDLLDKYKDAVRALMNVFYEYSQAIKQFAATVGMWDNGSLTCFKDELKALSSVLNEEHFDFSSFNKLQLEITELCETRKIKDLITTLSNQLKVLRPLVDANSKSKSDAWKLLNDSWENYKQSTDMQKKLRDYQLEQEKASFMLGAYDAAQATVLNKLFEDISFRFTEFYKTMHQGDEEAFTSSLVNSGVSVNMSVDFYGQGQYPPIAFHSEGHQDSMGIALFFALMEKLTTSEFGLVVLDDVVMSVDIEHRKNFCRLLIVSGGDKMIKNSGEKMS